MANWIPDPTEHAGPAAGWIAFLVTLVGGWWKARLRVRQDQRADREAEAASETSVAVSRVETTLIEQLQIRVDAMGKDFNALRDELARERVAKDQAILRALDAESKVARLTARIAHLEAEVEALKRGGLHPA